MIDVIKWKGDEYFTGNLKPSRKLCGVSMFPVPKYSHSEIVDAINDPERVKARQEFSPDWIYDQKNIGSCNGCAAAKALERARQRSGRPREVLSPEFIYANINGGRDVGSMLDDGMKFIRESGVAPWQPDHAQQYQKSAFDRDDYEQARRFKAFEVYGVDSELELATGLVLGFVGVVAVHANNDFMRLDSNGIAGGANGPGNHAVGVDDVSLINGRLAFDMFNSWGVRYGDKGRAFLTWNRHFDQPNQHHYFYLIRATSNDPGDDVPELQRD